ncbi:MAG TPA: cupin domain-containing protein [Stellaceae bacterium]|jgi:mannose-6-phosphate isomerase-like protein (cupin superfamily)|nr:cupin domain-containing protein [Stellaceae bacterium]
MTSAPWDTQEIATAPLVTAPDGSAVRVLCATARGGTATFTLEAGAVAKAVVHRTVEEIWYVAAGQGRLWRRAGEAEQIADLAPGRSLTIPVGTRFQFCNDGAGPLQIVAVTMPPWPGEGEAMLVDGIWPATV